MIEGGTFFAVFEVLREGPEVLLRPHRTQPETPGEYITGTLNADPWKDT